VPSTPSVGMCGAGPADAAPASDNDNPAAAPSAGTAVFKRLRFDDCSACDTGETFPQVESALAGRILGYALSPGGRLSAFLRWSSAESA
jgi:hypothetical protein